MAQARPDGATRKIVKNEAFRSAADDQPAFTCVSEGYAPGFTRRQRREALYQGRNDFAQSFFFHDSLEVDRAGPTGRRC